MEAQSKITQPVSEPKSSPEWNPEDHEQDLDQDETPPDISPPPELTTQPLKGFASPVFDEELF